MFSTLLLSPKISEKIERQCKFQTNYNIFFHSIIGDNKTISFQNILLDKIDKPANIFLLGTLTALNSNSDITDNKENIPGSGSKGTF